MFGGFIHFHFLLGSVGMDLPIVDMHIEVCEVDYSSAHKVCFGLFLPSILASLGVFIISWQILF